MRIHAGLIRTIRGDIVSTTTYLINKGPLVLIGFKIPKEEWQGRDVTLYHLKVYGCVSYVHVRDADKDMLDLKVRKCIFIVYEAYDKGYLFYNYQNRKVIRSRDVTFNENVVVHGQTWDKC